MTLPLPAHAPSALAPSNNAGLCCSIYGAVWGLGELGTTAVSILLLPKLDKAWSILTGYNTPGSKDSGGAGGEDSEEARTARALIVHIIGIHMHTHHPYDMLLMFAPHMRYVFRAIFDAFASISRVVLGIP